MTKKPSKTLTENYTDLNKKYQLLRYKLAGADETIKILGEKYSDLNKKYQLYKKAFEIACKDIAGTINCPIDYFHDEKYCEKHCLKESGKFMCWDRYYLKLAKEELEGKKNGRNDI